MPEVHNADAALHRDGDIYIFCKNTNNAHQSKPNKCKI